MISGLHFEADTERRYLYIQPKVDSQDGAQVSREIDATVLRSLIMRFAGLDVSQEETLPVDVIGSLEKYEKLGLDPVFSNLRVSGDLHLHCVELVRSLSLENCDFRGSVILRNAITKTISLRGSSVYTLDASEVRVHGSLLLGRPSTDQFLNTRFEGDELAPFRASACIDLSLARIDGDVVLSGAHLHFSNEGPADRLMAGCAIMAGGLKANAFWLDGAQVRGRVFLAGAKLDTMLSIRKSRLELPITFCGRGANTLGKETSEEAIRIYGPSEFRLVTLALNDMQLGTKLYIEDCEILGQARLARIEIGGDCLLMRTKFISSYALILRGLEERFNKSGEAILINLLSAAGVDKESHHLASLHASRADIGGGLFLNQAQSIGEMRLRNTRIRGVLNARGAFLVSLESMQLDQIAEAEAEYGERIRHVRETDTPYSRRLCSETSPQRIMSGIALCADRADINSTVFFGRENIDFADAILFRSYGEISMRQTRIGGSLNCRHARLYAPAFPAGASSAELGEGEVGHKPFVALALSGSQIGGTVFLSGDSGKEPFFAVGEIRLRGAKVSGNIIFYNGQFHHAPLHRYFDDETVIDRFYQSRPVINLRTTVVAGTLFFAPDIEIRKQNSHQKSGDRSAEVFGGIDFHLADCAALQDSETSWPKSVGERGFVDRIAQRLGRNIGKTAWLRLDGFKYRLLSGPTLSWRDRLKWLEMSRSAFSVGSYGRDFKSLQPYEQLAAVLKSQGFVHDASRILFRRGTLAWSPASASKQGGEWSTAIINFFVRPFLNKFREMSYFPDIGVRYIVIVMAAGTLLFGDFYTLGIMRPAEEEVLIGKAYIEQKTVPFEMSFSPFAYTIDVVTPGLDFRQERYWMPKVHTSTVEHPAFPFEAENEIKFVTPKKLSKSQELRLTIYNSWGFPYLSEFIARLLGWILFSVTIIGYSGILRPDREV